MRMIRRGKFMAELAAKNVNLFLPPSTLRDEWLKGIELCKDSGILYDFNWTILLYVECFNSILIFNR